MAPKKVVPKSRKPRAKTSSPRKKAAAGDNALSSRSRLSFPVVAIGASAGGLAAFMEMLSALPSESGMAFVLIQHLEPAHESALADILSRATRMVVLEVTDGMAVEADHVYVIPPNKNMTLRKLTLRLTPRSTAPGLYHPIDQFCLALAEEQGNAAIGVVLSGTGSDGTYGLKAIKAAGGVTFAQDPKTAEWPAMPLSAITDGSVDFVLSTNRIATELARIARHPYLAEALEVPEGSELDKIYLTLRSSVGVDFRLYKQPTVRRRIARRMALQKIDSLNNYARILRRNPEEAKALADDIFIPVTSFFRDPECFQALQKRVLAKLAVRKTAGGALRIWVPGCSTGEEVYSIAMLLLEELGKHRSRVKIQIFGTDIKERSVEHARTGVYKKTVVADVSPARLRRFFVKTDDGYQIQKSVRDLCVFARHDLAKDPPFSRLDVISCRNVLIYMGPELQQRVWSLFRYALKPGGFLFLGNSESISGADDSFTVEDRKHRIFSRKPVAYAFHMPGAGQDQLREPDAALPRVNTVDFRKEAEAVLLEYYTPPALIVDPDLHIVHFQGDTSPYITPATGQPSFHLLKMVRPELVVDLRTAIHEARKYGVPAHKRSVQFEHQGRLTAVRLEVRPMKNQKGQKQDLLIVFQKVEPAEEVRKAAGGRDKRAPEKTRLERELATTREELRALITEHEAAREEMKAASEETLSSNEELQTTTEALETAKEELQSSNEELITVNDELQNRNTELTVLAHDLNNLLVGVDIPVLVLDAGLRVRRFTPMAGTLFNLIQSDVGRPFSHIASNLDVFDWKELFSQVTDHGVSIEREVSDRNGHRYSLRVRPYKTDREQIDGVLVVLFDIDVIKRALKEAEESRRLALQAGQKSESILNSLVSHVAVIGADGAILSTNDAWNRFAQENGNVPLAAAGPGTNYLQVCRRAASEGASGAQAALDGIQAVLDGHRGFFRLEYPCHSSTAERWFLMNVSPLKGTTGGAVIAHLDISDRKLAEIKAQKSEATVHALLDSSTQSVVAVSADEKIVLVNGNTEKMFGYKREELVGQPVRILVPENLRARHVEHHRTYFADMQSRPMGIGLELEGCRKDGTHFPVEIALSVIEMPAGRLAVAFVSDITQRRRLEQAAQTHTQEIQALAASLLTAQEEERRRVSGLLHDKICQLLASLAIDMGGLAAAPPPAAEAQRRLRALQARAIKASEEARHLAYELYPSVLDDLGLVASLRALCNEFSEQNKDTILEFTGAALPNSISREVASCLYRIARESLHNIVKHASAKHVSVALDSQKGNIVLTIADDGVGFDVKAVQGRGRLGLVGMAERARLVNGKLSIAAQPGHGTRIALTVPLPVGGP